MALNESDLSIYDLVCTIRYARAIKQEHLIKNLRMRHIYPCLDRYKIGGQASQVDVQPLERWDASDFQRMSSMWSKPPWRMAFNGPCAKRAASGSYLPFYFLNLKFHNITHEQQLSSSHTI